MYDKWNIWKLSSPLEGLNTLNISSYLETFCLSQLAAFTWQRIEF